MASLYEELVSNLKQQIEYYDELLQISTEKTKVIVANDIESLSKINTVENMLVVRLEKLDKKNREVISDIIMVTGKKVDKLTVKGISTLLSKDEGAVLNKLADELVDVATRMKEVNDKNKILVDTSIEYSDFSMNVYRELLDKNVKVTYDNNGKIDN